MGPVRCPNGCRTGLTRESPIFFISTGPVRDPQGCRAANLGARELTRREFAKIPHRHRMWPYGARTAPYGPRTGWSRLLSPYGTRKLIIDALKIYGPVRGGKIRTGSVRVPWVDVRFLFKTALEQSRDSPYGVRECDVTGALVFIYHCFASIILVTNVLVMKPL